MEIAIFLILDGDDFAAVELPSKKKCQEIALRNKPANAIAEAAAEKRSKILQFPLYFFSLILCVIRKM